MTRDRILRIAAGATLVVALVLVVFFPLILGLLGLLAGPEDAAFGVLFEGGLEFQAAFYPGQSFGFLFIVLILLSAGYLALHMRKQPLLRTVLFLVLAAAAWVGAQGYRYQRRQTEEVFCLPPNKANPAALAFRAALNARVAADRAAKDFRFQVKADNLISPFFPAGMPVSQAETLTKDAGLHVRLPGKDERREWGKSLAFMAYCKFGYPEISMDADQEDNAAGQAVVSHTDATIMHDSGMP